ncbi:MAG: hypothetical protein AAF991_12240, partial [Pseudomonadota bacterium]
IVASHSVRYCFCVWAKMSASKELERPSVNEWRRPPVIFSTKEDRGKIAGRAHQVRYSFGHSSVKAQQKGI